ncbi:hypothetical protein V6L77_06400 [Pannonibacter sp. Pt2-lr]
MSRLVSDDRPGTQVRMLVYILLAYAVYVLFSRIPLPGLAPFVRDRVLTGDNDVQRMSLIALGLIPIMTVLIYAEILKVLFPPSWPLAKSRGFTARSSAFW